MTTAAGDVGGSGGGDSGEIGGEVSVAGGGGGGGEGGEGGGDGGVGTTVRHLPVASVLTPFSPSIALEPRQTYTSHSDLAGT